MAATLVRTVLVGGLNVCEVGTRVHPVRHRPMGMRLAVKTRRNLRFYRSLTMEYLTWIAALPFWLLGVPVLLAVMELMRLRSGR